MSPGEDEQRAIEDYLGGDSSGGDIPRTDSELAEGSDNSGRYNVDADWPSEIIGFDSPSDLLEDLENDGGISANTDEIVTQIARYLDGTSVSFSSKNRDEARQALETILAVTDPPIESPDLFRLIDDGFVDRELVLQHLLELVPVPVEEIPEDISVDTNRIGELTFGVRLDCYEVLAYGPPDPDVFAMLSSVASTFDSGIPLPGDDRNPNQWKREHARRIALSYLRDKNAAITEGLAGRAVQVAWFSVLPDLAANILSIIDTRVYDVLIDGLEKRRGVEALSKTTFVDDLVECFLDREGEFDTESVAYVTTVALEQGYLPASPSRLWNPLEEALFTTHDPGHTQDIMTAMVTPSLARDINAEAYVDHALAAYPREPGNPRDREPVTRERANAILKTLNRAIELGDQEILSEESARQLAVLTHVSTGEGRGLAVDCLVEVCRFDDGGDFLARSGALGKIIGTCEDVSSAAELDHYGRILEAAGVYPVPPVASLGRRAMPCIHHDCFVSLEESSHQ